MALANWSLAALRHENALLHQRERTLETQLRALTGGEPAPASLHGARRRLAETPDTSFTKERVTTIAVDKKLLLTFVNIVRIDFARTWVHHVRRLGMTNWLVGATDPRALRLAPGSSPTLTLTLTPHPDPNPKANPHPSPSPSREPSPLTLTLTLTLTRTPTLHSTLKEEGVACFDMKTNLPQGEWPWGSPSFKSLGPHKIELIFKTISWGFELVITDIDAACRDLGAPTPH
jgi:hypothetical protein